MCCHLSIFKQLRKGLNTNEAIQKLQIMIMHSRLSRCGTARGSNTSKVKAHKSFLFTEGSPEVESKVFATSSRQIYACCVL